MIENSLKMTTMITFNDMPNAIGELLERISIMGSQMNMMSRKIDELESKLAQSDMGVALICGRFKAGEFISMSDPRLWEGEGAPFTSRYQAKESRKYGCGWKAHGTNKTYKIQAEALRDYLSGICRKSR